MRRTLFTLAAAVSAALCVVVCVLWVRSYRDDAKSPGGEDRASWLHRGARYTARSVNGRVTLYAPPPDPPADAPRRP